ncbi:CDP-diacylglycerol--serine O-phosphatidyltransferase [Thermodesulfatator atlanticus]|uniref:CDP-diacylglycerol--serine O-phosphatidyltransferase n=1 Tax=Thermodesulfatator atlanticus TaxID=501497 RepID=UPI0003B5A588|nr:CDP-diacylglycerol--serine O-phosphatidyltransferase [Thermodesulfatator atlanticus]
MAEKINKRKKKKDKRNRIYLLPNLFTTGNLFCGFFGLIAAIEGHYAKAAIAILFAMIFDILDGRIARFTGATSRFGIEYDSLCDLVSFGVAPAILVFTFALESYGRYGWLAAFLYVACAALRLAKFNVQAAREPNYFSGLPSPGAAGLMASTVLFSLWIGLEQPVKHIAILLMVYIVSYLMVSNAPYPSFKKLTFAERHPFYSLVFFVLFLTVIAAEPHVTLFVGFLLYATSGPFLLALRARRGQKVPVSSEIQ